MSDTNIVKKKDFTEQLYEKYKKFKSEKEDKRVSDLSVMIIIPESKVSLVIGSKGR